MASITILWLRRALRLADNPALLWACERAAGGGGAVIPVYIDPPDKDGDWPMGGASRWWLHHSLEALQGAIKEKRSRLILRSGTCEQVLRELIEETGAEAICWDRCYEPAAVGRDKVIKSNLRNDGIEVKSFNTSLLFEPWEVQTGEGNPYKVFTPFWKTCTQRPAPGKPLSAPKSIPAPKKWPKSLKLDDLELLPEIDWAGGMREAWTPGESGAIKALERFRKSAVADYPDGRDRPDKPGTSRLSPHLHFGEISPRQVWHKLAPGSQSGMSESDRKSAWAYLREVGWREFAYHLLYHFPHTPCEPLRPEFKKFPWRKDAKALKAWQKGNTGYPIVDAGMRELWHTGWMHNRVRMIVASFLVKDLLLPWQEGAAWFWDTLVDADLANNTLGWQWTAGCGADAAPYFRVFNPTLQGKKFDPDGAYVRRWIPELAKLDARYIHEPTKAPADALKRAGITLGKDYPKPIVDHGEARDRALAALDTIKKNK
jgi:deoxyribodipyrimidine photo-lyase